MLPSSYDTGFLLSSLNQNSKSQLNFRLSEAFKFQGTDSQGFQENYILFFEKFGSLVNKNEGISFDRNWTDNNPINPWIHLSGSKIKVLQTI